MTSGSPGTLDPHVLAAFTSFLAPVGPEPAATLLATARQRTAWPGELLVREDQADQAGVLIEGMLRTVVALPDGRMATIHYPTPVAFFGLTTIFAPVPFSIHVMRKATIVELDGNELRRCVREFPEFGWSLSRQLAQAIGRVPTLIEEFGFKTVIQRVATHLISLSEPAGLNGERAVHITHAALAEYVESAREVVSRCLLSLADDGMVAPGHGVVRITDEGRLRRMTGQA